MNNIINRVWNRGTMVNIEDLRGSLYQNEQLGHTFVISGVDGDGNVVSLSGTVDGAFLRPDNTTVAISGSASGGKAYVTLPANCYDVPGKCGLTIYLTADSQKTALYAAVVTVTRTSSGTASPGTTASVVDLVNAINAAISQIPATDTAIKAAMAPTYSNTGLYAVGSYAWYNGTLYRCTTAITTAESWTSGHWTAAALGNDLRDLKSAFDTCTGNEIIQLINGYYIVTSKNVGQTLDNITPIQGGATNNYAIVNVSEEGELFTLNGTGGNAARLYCFIDSNLKVLAVAGEGETASNKVLTAPATANKLIINTIGAHSVICRNKYIKTQVNELESSTDEKFNFLNLLNFEAKPVALTPYYTDKAILLNSNPVNINGPVNNTGNYAYVVTCNEGDIFTINANGGNNARAYAFLNSSYTVIDSADAYATISNEVIMAPPSSAYLIINDMSPHRLSYRGIYYSEQIEDVKENIAEFGVLKIWENLALEKKKMLNADGSTISSFDVSITPFIDIHQYKNLELQNLTGNNAAYCLYSSSKSRITGEAYSGDSKKVIDNTSGTYYYIRYSITNDNCQLIAKDGYNKYVRNDIENAIKESYVPSRTAYNWTWEQGGFYSNLNDVNSDGRVRSPILEMQDYNLCIILKPGFTVTIGDKITNKLYKGSVFYKVDAPQIRIAVGKIGNTDIVPSDVTSDTVTIMVIPKKVQSSSYDVIVCASDSSYDDKVKSDIICDGVHDERFIEAAINSNVWHTSGVKVYLCAGNYTISSFNKHYNYDFSELIGKSAIQSDIIRDNNTFRRYHVQIDGAQPSLPLVMPQTVISVSDDALATLSTTEDNAVFTMPRFGSSDMGLVGSTYSLEINNIQIYTNGVENNIIGIDGAAVSKLSVKGCTIASELNMADIKLDLVDFKDGSIGIRGTHGSCFGIGQELRSNRVMGFKEGLAITGEHFICEDNLQHHCYYGFTVGNYPVKVAMEHPNIFIGNSVEQCVIMGLLNRYGASQTSESTPSETIVYIGGSVEDTWTDSNGDSVAMLPIVERVQGSYRGRIESDFYGNTIFDQGSGRNIKFTIYTQSGIVEGRGGT